MTRDVLGSHWLGAAGILQQQGDIARGASFTLWMGGDLELSLDRKGTPLPA